MSARHIVWGAGATHSHSSVSASHGRSRPALPILLDRSVVCDPPSLGGKVVYCSADVSAGRGTTRRRFDSCGQSAPMMRASLAVIELRPVIYGGTSMLCSCLEEQPGRSW